MKILDKNIGNIGSTLIYVSLCFQHASFGLKKMSEDVIDLRQTSARSDLAEITDKRVGQSWITRPIRDEQAVIF